MSMGEALTAREVERRIVTLVRDRLPENWKAADAAEPQQGSPRPDVVIRVEAPDGSTATLRVEAKQVVERRDVARMVEQLRSGESARGEIPVVAARYLSSSVREALAGAGVAYADATGNMRIAVDSPAIFMSDRGEDRDPWRMGRPRGTLKGEPAARVARALIDHDREWTVRELIAASGASTGATYRVLEYLEREDLVVKNGKRSRVTDWERLLRSWSAESTFGSTARVMTFIEPRGLDAFLAKVATEATFSTAVTGSIAARQWATYAPAKAAYVYVSSIQDASDQWGLRLNSAAPNVILLEPKAVGDVPFQNTVPAAGGYSVAAPAQVAADLLNGPGREPAEGNHLIEWMRANERSWRHE